MVENEPKSTVAASKSRLLIGFCKVLERTLFPIFGSKMKGCR